MLGQQIATPLWRVARARLSAYRSYHELSFQSTGDPVHVLRYEQYQEETPATNPDEQISVEMLYAPWNPADMNTVQGKYPKLNNQAAEYVKSRHLEGFMVAGSEGLGKITSLGSLQCGDRLKVGDHVAIGLPGLGTMRSKLIVPSEDCLIPIHRYQELESKIGGAASSALLQLGGTAYRMLSDFVDLKPGDTVVQNAGSSAVAFMVSQIASSFYQAHVVSLVRRGSRSEEEFQQLQEHLRKGEASLIFSDEDIQTSKDAMRNFKSKVKEISLDGKLPKLALNAVGGTSASTLLRTLGGGGTMVTYGGLSMQPVTVSTPQLIFNDVSVQGFWFSRWMMQNDVEARKKMLNTLVDGVLDGKLRPPPIEEVVLSGAKERIALNCSSAISKKLIFNCQEGHG